MRIIMFGPPGSGKGTQAEQLRNEWGLAQISTGAILRDAIQQKTPTGLKAKEYIDKGELVPDDLMTRVVEDRLDMEDCTKGFILDGFPRTIAQAEALETILQSRGLTVDAVVSLLVNEGEVVHRMVNRGRDDDNEEVIRNRLKVYREETEPLVAYFKDRGNLVEVSGMGTVKEIAQRIRTAITVFVSKDNSGPRVETPGTRT
jgi:adenylate kinase